MQPRPYWHEGLHSKSCLRRPSASGPDNHLGNANGSNCDGKARSHTNCLQAARSLRLRENPKAAVVYAPGNFTYRECACMKTQSGCSVYARVRTNCWLKMYLSARPMSTAQRACVFTSMREGGGRVDQQRKVGRRLRARERERGEVETKEIYIVLLVLG